MSINCILKDQYTIDRQQVGFLMEAEWFLDKDGARMRLLDVDLLDSEVWFEYETPKPYGACGRTYDLA